MLRDDPVRFTAACRLLLHAARAEGIGPARLPGFLGLEHGGELALLGQQELDLSMLEAELRDQIAEYRDTSTLPDLESERDPAGRGPSRPARVRPAGPGQLRRQLP